MSEDLMDERRLAAALARFEGFQKNKPIWIKEDIVDEYHAIVDAIAAETNENLDDFKIPSAEVKPKILGSRPAPYGGFNRQVMYSSDKYCDTGRFYRQVESLAEYLQSTGRRSVQTAHGARRPRGSSGHT